MTTGKSDICGWLVRPVPGLPGAAPGTRVPAPAGPAGRVTSGGGGGGASVGAPAGARRAGGAPYDEAHVLRLRNGPRGTAPGALRDPSGPAAGPSRVPTACRPRRARAAGRAGEPHPVWRARVTRRPG